MKAITSNTRIFKALICTAVALLLATACKKDEPGPIPGSACYDYVTLDSSVKGEGSTFSMQRSDDSPMIYYNTSHYFSNDTVVSAGMRLIISYARLNGDEPYTSGPIDLYGYRLLDNTSQSLITEIPQEEDFWTTDWLKPLAMTRTGKYINITSMLSCTQQKKAKSYVLALVPETAGNEYPVLQLIYKAESPGDNSYTSYASFDISAVWDKETCKGVTISYKSQNGPDTKTFYR